MDTRDYLRFAHDLQMFNMEGRVDTNHRLQKTTPLHTDIGCPYEGELVRIHFFCLMPNHYHLLISPLIENGISKFMKKLNMGYAKYFNERYGRSGALFQGKYKSIHVTDDAHFMYLPYYIHLNPLDVSLPSWRDGKISNVSHVLAILEKYKWSSHRDYLGHINFPSVTDRAFFLKYYNGTAGYIKSLKKYLDAFDVSDLSTIKPLTLE